MLPSSASRAATAVAQPPARPPSPPTGSTDFSAKLRAAAQSADTFRRFLLDLFDCDEGRDALLDLLGPTIAESQADLIDDHVRERHGPGADVRSPRLESSVPPAPADVDDQVDVYWDDFISNYPGCPSRAAQDDARAFFYRLPWSAEFHKQFFEGLDHWLGSERWAEGFVCSPKTFIVEERWRKRVRQAAKADTAARPEDVTRRQVANAAAVREEAERHRRDDDPKAWEMLARVVRGIGRDVDARQAG